MTKERIDFLGLPLSIDVALDDVCALPSAKGGLRMVTFINPQAWAIAQGRQDFVNALNQMTLVLPDGEGVARGCRILTEKSCPRLSFDMSSLANPFFETLTETNDSVMLIGGNPGVDENVKAKLLTNYSKLRVIGTEHGYGDIKPKVDAVLDKKPDVVIVGMGSPHQEYFLLSLKEAGYQGLAITCGGFLDQYLEKEQYYPSLVNRWNLRFAWRLYKEPKRLWRRYLVDYQIMIKLVCKALYSKMLQIY